MASFELYDYESGETKISLIPQYKRYEFLNVFWYEYNEPGEPLEKIEYLSSFNYDDIILLRNFLNTTIDLYNQKVKEREKIIEQRIKAKKDSSNNKFSAN